MDKKIYRDMALVAVFGALWALTEATCGSILHLFNFPATGLVMTFIVSLFIFPAVKLINRRGAAFQMAMIACCVKLFSMGGFRMGPVFAISMEGVLLEFLFPLFKRGLFGFIVSGIIFCLAPLLHQSVIATLLFGRGIIGVIPEIVARLERTWPFFQGGAGMILWSYFALHFCLGTLAGFLSWKINRSITLRLG